MTGTKRSKKNGMGMDDMFLRLYWQHTRGSALLGFVADDAAFIAGRIDGDREPSAERSTNPAPQAAGATKGAF